MRTQRSQPLSARVPIDNLQSTDAFRRINGKLKKKSTRKKLVRYGILGVNAMLLFGVMGFVLLGQGSSEASPEKSISAVKASSEIANPLDQVSSTEIAVNVARMSGLEESTKLTEDADSIDIELSLVPAGTSIVAKPQVVATALKSKKDIRTYVTVPGDTIAALATKFGVTSDSIRWSNDLTSNSLTPGKTLVIPPDTGIVYTVKAGDTADSLAGKFKADKGELIAANDAELMPIKAGDRIYIPKGTQPTAVNAAASSVAAWGGPTNGGNLYTFGYCTWYVANKVAVPSNWGNANTWDIRAALSGWTVSPIPRAGAIGQSDRGSEGHVAYIEAVSEDGTMIKYSDMNGLAGWGRVGYSNWAPISKFETYIYR